MHDAQVLISNIILQYVVARLFGKIADSRTVRKTSKKKFIRCVKWTEESPERAPNNCFWFGNQQNEEVLDNDSKYKRNIHKSRLI